MIKKILVALLLVFIVMQFFRIDKTNPPVTEEKDFMSINNGDIAMNGIIKNSCYDCHSNTTTYPWYTNIAPVSWWLKGHVDHGRGNLNFSEWGDLDKDKRKHKLEECSYLVRKSRMPISSYLLMHSGARMSDEEREKLASYFDSLRDI